MDVPSTSSKGSRDHAVMRDHTAIMTLKKRGHEDDEENDSSSSGLESLGPEEEDTVQRIKNLEKMREHNKER